MHVTVSLDPPLALRFAHPCDAVTQEVHPFAQLARIGVTSK